MAEQYWVGDFFVDVSRNQVTQKQQSQKIAPKALAVLTYLAKNQGKVVSYDELLDNVWPNTVVSPNTLQRCIAQLRKVLEQNTSQHSYIKTHAKQGYSLECDVKWKLNTDVVNTGNTVNSDNTDTSIPPASALHNQTNIYHNEEVTGLNAPRPVIKYLLSLVVIIAAILASLQWNSNVSTSTSVSQNNLVFDELRPLTATDDKEYAASYTPDGQYVVYQRYANKLCMSNLWAKNLQSQQEFQLVDNIGTYGTHSFSPDGKKLTFVNSQNCEQPISSTLSDQQTSSQQRCYHLMSIDFDAALKNPQAKSLLIECKNSQLKKPLWLDNENILLMLKKQSTWQLIKYSITDKTSTTLFSPIDEKLVAYDYSAKEQLIAITSINKTGDRYLNLLKANGDVVSSSKIAFPEKFSQFTFIKPTFDNENKQLVFSSVRQLYALSYQGKVSPIPLPLAAKIENPVFHPNGGKMLLIKMSYDSDLALVKLANLPVKAEVNTVIARSNLAEEYAQFQPNGNAIAFVSDRSGHDQLWLSKNSENKMISTFPANTLIRGFDWSADGNNLLVNASGRLTIVNLGNKSVAQNKQQNIKVKHPIIQLFHWHDKANTALVNISIHGASKLVELDLNTLNYTVIANTKAVWAQKSPEGTIIYSDKRDRFWQYSTLENQLIEPLSSQNLNVKFLLKNNHIYGINKNKELLAYNMATQQLSTQAVLADNIDYITDISESHALFELTISGKKEVVELSKSH